MKPGATIMLLASISLFPFSGTTPIETIRPFLSATSAKKAGLPVPSTMRPCRMTKSYVSEIAGVASKNDEKRSSKRLLMSERYSAEIRAAISDLGTRGSRSLVEQSLDRIEIGGFQGRK